MNDQFESIIGLEIHAQIATKTKMFCPCSCDSFNKEPNLNVCPVCMGFPGQLPVINREALTKGVKAALALHCEIPPFSKFDRKNYFYPDLPKGYQISQYDQPVSQNGWLDIQVDGEKKRIRITRLHLEDDAGKLTHVENGTLCDYNRSGIALMEIVSEPDIRTSGQAGAYARTIQTILRYTGSSEADMEKGMMRFDASVSIRKKGETGLNPRAEIKNLNSFRSLESAIDYEIERQIQLTMEGKALTGDITVGWNDELQKTYFLRDKEGAHDYRYFPEPDLPPLSVTEDFIEALRKEIPELPGDKYDRYQNDWNISPAEALLISNDVSLAKFFEEMVTVCNDPKKSSSFLTSILLGRLKKDGMELKDCQASPTLLGNLIQLVNKGKISMNMAKTEVFEGIYEDGKDPETIIKEKGLVQMNDTNELEKICQIVMAQNPKSVEDYRNGKNAALQFLVGQVMKATKGQAQAPTVQQLLAQQLKI